LPLGDLPILEIVMRRLIASGVSRIVIALGHMPQLFMATIGSGSRWGIQLEYVSEERAMGTAGALQLVKDPQENFLVMNGDILTTLDFAELFRYHHTENAYATIALAERKVEIDYGVIYANDSGDLERYVEKPTLSYFVSMGVNVLSRHCLEFIPRDKPFDMPQLMMAMREAGLRVCCRREICYWKDIGRFEDYEQASADFAGDASRFLG
jgi:NDP-sugar pyrophosphorylase family protein